MGSHELDLGFVELAGAVAVEDLCKGLLELRDRAFAGLPGGGSSEEDSVPVVGGEGFTVVVPNGVELAGGADFLAVAGELLDVEQAVVVVGVDAGPVVNARGDPGLKAGVGVGLEVLQKAVRVGVVLPADGDGVALELRGHGLEEVGRILRDVTPEKEAAVERAEGGVDLLHEVEIDLAEAVLVDGCFGLAYAEVDSFVRSDVQKG